MVTNTYGRWAPRLATLLLWALAGATAVYWGLKLSASPGGTAPAAAAPEPVVTDTQALARLLGASPVLAAAEAAPSAASRFVLMGVLAGTASGGGAALIAVDGKPAKPVRVGAPDYDGPLADVVRTPRFANAMGLVEEARQLRLRGRKVAEQSGSFKDTLRRLKEWFLGNF